MLTSTFSIKHFMETFFHDVEDLKYAPKRVQLEWERGQDDLEGYDHDLTVMLRMHARSPVTQFRFVPWKVAFDYNQWDGSCWHCINEMEEEARGEEDYDNPVEDCTCTPNDMELEDWAPYQYQLINRTDILEKIIVNNTSTWLDAVRSNIVNVTATFEKQADPITFRILCKNRFCSAEITDVSSYAENAWNLLQTWGMFDLPFQDDMAFVVAFKLEGAINKDDRRVTSKEVREVVVGNPGSAAK